MDQRVSGMIGVVGGIVDIVAGFAFLQQPMGPQPMMRLAFTSWIGYFLLVLGVIVLASGLYVLTVRMMNRSSFGWLMIVYGVIMLVLGFGMIGQMFSMMEGSWLSGSVMLIVGVAMLYSGYDMTRM